MNKVKETIQDRSDYVKKVVGKAAHTEKAVQTLASELFLSSRTIYRDLAK